MFSFFLFIEKSVSHEILSVNRSHALCTRPTTSLTSKSFTEMCLSMGLMHCSQDPQISFFNKTFIKNWFHGTIHIFKNYFITVFLIFSKINDIQTNLKILGSSPLREWCV